MDLRWYQAEAKAAIYDYLSTNAEGNPCAVLPTGSGKTPLLASICEDVAGKWGGRVLVLAHVRELLEQASDKLRRFLPEDSIGIYCAGLNEKTTDAPVICASIQSAYRKSGSLGAFSIIIVDEAHLIPAHHGGMYRDFLAEALLANPKMRVVGLTATPYRLDCGSICDDGDEKILSKIVYDAPIRELISQGFLANIKAVEGTAKPYLEGIHTRGGEYIESEMAERMSAIVDSACTEIVDLTAERKRVLVFSSSIDHGREVQEALAEKSCQEVGFVSGNTPKSERAELLGRFKDPDGGLKYLVNVNVLTTGFDAPNIDAIALLRATLSPGLYYQMCGRGLRVCDGKDDCIVLDYGKNAIRHGPIDAMSVRNKSAATAGGMAPGRTCEACQCVSPISAECCVFCGHPFPLPEYDPHDEHATAGAMLSDEIQEREIEVTGVSYFIHSKKDDETAPKTMRVEYLHGSIADRPYREWVCFSHDGYARNKAEAWWRKRSRIEVPDTTEDAVRLAKAGALAETLGIVWRKKAGAKFGEIVRYTIHEELPTDETVAEYFEAQRKASGFDGESAAMEWDDEIPF